VLVEPGPSQLSVLIRVTSRCRALERVGRCGPAGHHACGEDRRRRARLEARLTDAYKPPPESPQCGAGSEERGRWFRLWRNATAIDDPAVAPCITNQIRVLYEQLQAEERRVLQEVRALEAAEKRCCEYEYDKSALLQAERGRKKMKPVPSSSVSVPAAPVEVLELRVSEVGDRVLVVNVTARRRHQLLGRLHLVRQDCSQSKGRRGSTGFDSLCRGCSMNSCPSCCWDSAGCSSFSIFRCWMLPVLFFQHV
ncbi:uncharacterized protein, partial [Miscanthus floridulus]|uniref:uncharacterized protein n=1 Tax=Miscanthus floridulus TaxID=154761 RepID=UPI00345AC94C